MLIEEIIIYGTISGGTYALLALGFTLIYGVSEVVNLAHGSLFMLASYMFFALTIRFFQLGLLPAMILATIFVAVVASILYRLTIHPVLGNTLSIMVITISLAIIFQELMVLVFTSSPQKVPSIGAEFARILGVNELVIIWGVKLTFSEIFAFVVSLALFAILLIFVAKSKIGRAMRAASQDREVAMLMGVNTERLYMLTMALSAALAAVAGILLTSSTGGGQTNPYLWRNPLFMSFAIVILGGLGSIKGSFIGAFIIAYVEKTFIFEVDHIIANMLGMPKGGSLSGAVIMATMMLILIIRPKGLFGKRVELE